MGFQFKKHYTREEAEALLPEIRRWLGDLDQLRDQLPRLEDKINFLLGAGADAGGRDVTTYLLTLAEMKETLRKFAQKDIQLKDLDRGLIDFPAFVGGKEVFLCWEKDEDSIEFWHDLHSGYTGREKL